MQLQIDERALLSELNKMRQAKAKKDHEKSEKTTTYRPELSPEDAALFGEQPEVAEAAPQPEKESDTQEKEIIRLLLLYGNKMIDWDGIANTYIGPFMVAELSDVEFEQPVCKEFLEIYRQEVENGVLPDEQFFIHSQDKNLVDLTVNL